MINSLFSYYEEIVHDDDLKIYEFIFEQSGLYNFKFDKETLSTNDIVDSVIDNLIKMTPENYQDQPSISLRSFDECRRLLYQSFLGEYDYFYKQYLNDDSVIIKAIDVKTKFKDILDSNLIKFNSNSIDSSYSRNIKILNDRIYSTNSYILKALYKENFCKGKIQYYSSDANFCMNIILRLNKLPTSECYNLSKYTYSHLIKYLNTFIGLDLNNTTTNYLLEKLLNINSLAKINECYNQYTRTFDFKKLYTDKTIEKFMKKSHEERVVDSLVDILTNVSLSYGVHNRFEIMDIIYSDFVDSAMEMGLNWHAQWNKLFKEEEYICIILTLIYHILLSKKRIITHDEKIHLPIFSYNGNAISPMIDFEQSYVDITHKISDRIFFRENNLYPSLKDTNLIEIFRENIRSSIINTIEYSETKYDSLFFGL